jgi:hypothetical protein
VKPPPENKLEDFLPVSRTFHTQRERERERERGKKALTCIPLLAFVEFPLSCDGLFYNILLKHDDRYT